MKKLIILISLFLVGNYTHARIVEAARVIGTAVRNTGKFLRYVATLESSQRKVITLHISALAAQKLTDLEIQDDPNALCAAGRTVEALMEVANRHEEINTTSIPDTKENKN